MKKLLVLATVLALVPLATVQAQVVVGFGAGIRSSSLSIDSPDGDDEGLDGSRTGIAVGAFLGIPVSETFRFQPGIGYAQKGASDSEGGVDFNLELDYLQVPLYGVFSIPSESSVGVHLFGGPVLGFELSCGVTGEEGGVSVDLDCDSDGADITTNSFDFGVGVGAAVSFATSETMSIFVAGHYTHGLSNIADSDDDETAKNRSLGLDIGLAFRTGG